MIGGREEGQKGKFTFLSFVLTEQKWSYSPNRQQLNVTFQLRNMNFLNFSVLLFFAHLLYQIKGTSLPSSHFITYSKGPTDFFG